MPDRPVTVPPTLYALTEQTTRTAVTAALPTAPVPMDTEQTCVGFDGCVLTVTAYIAPLASCVGKAKVPLALTVTSSPPLSSRTTLPPARPVTWPPIAKLSVEQLTTTSVMPVLPMVPVPPVTVQVCVGIVGCVLTVTANAEPVVSAVANVKVPSALMARSSPPLSSSTSPPPARPITLPPTANLAGAASRPAASVPPSRGVLPSPD